MGRTGLELKKAIIRALKNNSLSLRRLETKLDTNNKTILMHVKELEYLGVIKIKKVKNPKNNRISTVVELSEYGKILA